MLEKKEKLNEEEDKELFKVNNINNSQRSTIECKSYFNAQNNDNGCDESKILLNKSAFREECQLEILNETAKQKQQDHLVNVDKTVDKGKYISF